MEFGFRAEVYNWVPRIPTFSKQEISPPLQKERVVWGRSECEEGFGAENSSRAISGHSQDVFKLL